jgi:hypothetical protein
MTKYYRVRTQEQWDWLMQWFENENKNIKWVNGSENPSNSKIRDNIIGNNAITNVGLYIKLDVYNLISYGYDTEMHTHDYIEVSQMMEESKMEDYVTIKGEDLKNIEMFRGDESKGNLEELWDVNKVNIPKSLLYPKVRMSVAEKKEFDELKNYSPLLSVAITRVDMAGGKYQHLYSKFFNHETTKEDVNAQNDFARAWADESLIEVFEPVKFKVKVPNSHSSYYFKSRYGKLQSTYEQLEDHRFQFTAEEIKHYHLDNDLFEKVEVSE